jgi:hypothetical protein
MSLSIQAASARFQDHAAAAAAHNRSGNPAFQVRSREFTISRGHAAGSLANAIQTHLGEYRRDVLTSLLKARKLNRVFGKHRYARSTGGLTHEARHDHGSYSHRRCQFEVYREASWATAA